MKKEQWYNHYCKKKNGVTFTSMSIETAAAAQRRLSKEFGEPVKVYKSVKQG